jgi:hypothetical protein
MPTGEYAMNEVKQAPDEEKIIEAILDGNDKAARDLEKQEPSLKNLIGEVKSVTDGLKSIEEVEPPPLPTRTIFNKKETRQFSWLQNLPLEWYKNPYILSFGFLMAIIFFYFLIAVIVKF